MFGNLDLDFHEQIALAAAAQLLDAAEDPDRVYTEEVLPQKMKYNLESLRQFSLWQDVKVMVMTVLAILGKKYEEA